VKIGLFCTTPMVAITRAIGRKAAMEMLLTGRYFPAREAKALGLVNHVVPLEDLAAKTDTMARQIAEASAMVLGIGKQAFYAQVDQPDDKAMAYASHTIVMNNMAQDAQNGIKAFLNKATPAWENR
jgi:enoyl-CoA hydratase/carnithine racemase